MSTTKTVKAGTLLLVSHGAYSSYSRVGWFIVVQDFNPKDVLASFLSESVENGKPYRFDETEFIAWVLRQGLMTEVQEFFDEWFLGDYGQADEILFLERGPSLPEEL